MKFYGESNGEARNRERNHSQMRRVTGTEHKAPVIRLLCNGLRFFRRIAGKYAFSGEFGRFPALVFLKHSGLARFNHVTNIHVTQLIHNHFKRNYNLHYHAPLRTNRETVLRDSPFSMNTARGGFDVSNIPHKTYINIFPRASHTGGAPAPATPGMQAAAKSRHHLKEGDTPPSRDAGLRLHLRGQANLFHRITSENRVFSRVVHRLLRMVSHGQRGVAIRGRVRKPGHGLSPDGKTVFSNGMLLHKGMTVNRLAKYKDAFPSTAGKVPGTHFKGKQHPFRGMQFTGGHYPARETFPGETPGSPLLSAIYNTIINPPVLRHNPFLHSRAVQQGEISRVFSPLKGDSAEANTFIPLLPAKNLDFATGGENLFHYKQQKIADKVENLKKILAEVKEAAAEKSLPAASPADAEKKEYLELKRLAERVYEQIEQKLILERERKGV